MSRRGGPLVRLGQRLLSLVATSDRNRQGILGDLDEFYSDRRDAGGGFSADVWYLTEAAVAAVRLGWRSWRMGGGSGMEWIREFRLAARRLAKTPTLTVSAILTLTLGIGATLAMFAVVSGVFLEPLPYPEPERLVVIQHDVPGVSMGSGILRIAGYAGQYLHYVERSRELESLAGYGAFDAALSGDGDAEYLRMGYVTPSLFGLLGAPATVGRTFLADEPDPMIDGHGTVVLSNSLWRSRYGNDPSVVGRFITLEGVQHEVIGVMPKEFRLPVEDVALTRPWTRRTLTQYPDRPFNRIIARLAPGATPESAQRELDALIAELPERFTSGDIPLMVGAQMRSRVTPMKEWVVRGVVPTLWILLGSVAVVLVIACTNVANLLLVRGDARRRERAIRTVLGAGPAATVRLFATEILLLVGAATVSGLVLAGGIVQVLKVLLPSQLPRVDEVAIDSSVVLLAMGLAVGCVAIFCAIALVQGRGSGLAALNDGGRGRTAGRRRMILRHTLVGSQMTMTLVLLVASTLLLRSFWSLIRVDIGFESSDILTFQVVYPTAELQNAGPGEFHATPFFTTLAEQIEELPGAERAGFADCIPIVASCMGAWVLRPSSPVDSDAAEPVTAAILRTSSGYLDALGITTVAGRPLTRSDQVELNRDVLVSRGLADSFWPGELATGKLLYDFGLESTPRPLTVVGVVEDIQTVSLRFPEPLPLMYAPLLGRGEEENREVWNAWFVVRTSVPPLSLVSAIRDKVRSLRPDVPVANAETMDSRVIQATGRLRIVMWLLAAASVLALVLSAIGVYGIVAYTVGLRRSEFGIRQALGAEASQVRNMVLGHGLLISVAGLSIGMVIAAGTSRLLSGFLFDVPPLDPLTYGAVFTFLLSITAVATLVPATCASRTAPSEALQAD